LIEYQRGHQNKMKLESQVISLESAKNLKELGIDKESIFVWEYYDPKCHGVKYFPYAVIPNQFNKLKLYSAFTVSEIFDILPSRINIQRDEPFDNFRLNMNTCMIGTNDATKFIKHYAINYHCDSLAGDEIFAQPRRLFGHNILDSNLAECCAKVLIRLIEEGYLTI
jgi:hypothetical protein